MSRTCRTFCSTMSTVNPSARMRRTRSNTCSRSRGARPADRQRGEARGRLIHEQKLWARHEGTTDRAHLLLAAGERAGELAAPLLETREELEDPVEPLGETPAGPRG